jgi:hypothetical protein
MAEHQKPATAKSLRRRWPEVFIIGIEGLLDCFRTADGVFSTQTPFMIQ